MEELLTFVFGCIFFGLVCGIFSRAGQIRDQLIHTNKQLTMIGNLLVERVPAPPPAPFVAPKFRSLD
jgi:hypothetical protein